MRNTTIYFLIISFFIGFISCSDDEMMTGDDCPPPSENYESGVFIINEGGLNSTGTLSFFNPTNEEANNLIYQNANCDDIIGSIFQSVTHVDNRLYMVANNANKMLITDDTTIDKIAEVTTLDSPRYFLKINENTGYISQWTKTSLQGHIAVIDLNTLEITKTIPAGVGPEGMIEYEGKIYVANGGGFDEDFGDSTVTIINPNMHEVEKTLMVGRNPNSFQIDKNGDLWVGCTGFRNSVFDNDPLNINGALARISGEVVQEIINLEKLGAQKIATNLAKDVIYLIHGTTFSAPIYTFNVDTKQLSETPFIDRNVYGIGVNPMNGHIFIADPKSFDVSGEVIEHDENGILLKTFFTSIAPNGFIFK